MTSSIRPSLSTMFGVPALAQLTFLHLASQELRNSHHVSKLWQKTIKENALLLNWMTADAWYPPRRFTLTEMMSGTTCFATSDRFPRIPFTIQCSCVGTTTDGLVIAYRVGAVFLQEVFPRTKGESRLNALSEYQKAREGLILDVRRRLLRGPSTSSSSKVTTPVMRKRLFLNIAQWVLNFFDAKTLAHLQTVQKSWKNIIQNELQLSHRRIVEGWFPCVYEFIDVREKRLSFPIVRGWHNEPIPIAQYRLHSHTIRTLTFEMRIYKFRGLITLEMRPHADPMESLLETLRKRRLLQFLERHHVIESVIGIQRIAFSQEVTWPS